MGHLELLHCCATGNTTGVDQFITNNPQINLNCENNNNETPLFIVCSNGYTDIVKLLLKDKRVNVNKPNGSGQTPFLVACWKGHIGIVKLLLNDKRVNINKEDVYAQTPLNMACQNEQIKSIQYILASGRNVNVNAKDYRGKTAIRIARERCNEEMGWNPQQLQKRKEVYGSIVELLESFEKSPNNTRFNLRLQLRLAGNFSIELTSKIFFFITYDNLSFFLSFKRNLCC